MAPQFRSQGIGYIRLGDDMSMYGVAFLSVDAGSTFLDYGIASILSDDQTSAQAKDRRISIESNSTIASDYSSVSGVNSITGMVTKQNTNANRNSGFPTTTSSSSSSSSNNSNRAISPSKLRPNIRSANSNNNNGSSGSGSGNGSGFDTRNSINNNNNNNNPFGHQSAPSIAYSIKHPGSNDGGDMSTPSPTSLGLSSPLRSRTPGRSRISQYSVLSNDSDLEMPSLPHTAAWISSPTSDASSTPYTPSINSSVHRDSTSNSNGKKFFPSTPNSEFSPLSNNNNESITSMIDERPIKPMNQNNNIRI